MAIRYQADADLNQIIVTAMFRRFPEIDFRTATAAGLAGVKDPDVLALAARDGRVLVTHDHTTMPRHFTAFIRATASPGADHHSAESRRSRNGGRPDPDLGSNGTKRME